MNLIYEHHLNPAIFKLGPLQPRWYAVMYILGFIVTYFIVSKHPKFVGRGFTKDDAMDSLTYGFFGVILGGRFGYVLFYNLSYYLSHPTKILAVWEGGMSFHGGLIGSIIACALFAYHKKIPIFAFYDIVALPTPLALMLGRIGNFINGELWGKETDGTWGFRFVEGISASGEKIYGPLRHPTMLYEGFLEGLVLFIVLWVATKYFTKLKDGSIGALFLIGYGCARVTIEFWRMPDAQIKYLMGTDWLTMGDVLSTPMIIGGLLLLIVVNLIPSKSSNADSEIETHADISSEPHISETN